MITMFEPDESTMIPVVKRMNHPQPNLIYTIGVLLPTAFIPMVSRSPLGLIYKVPPSLTRVTPL